MIEFFHFMPPFHTITHISPHLYFSILIFYKKIKCFKKEATIKYTGKPCPVPVEIDPPHDFPYGMFFIFLKLRLWLSALLFPAPTQVF